MSRQVYNRMELYLNSLRQCPSCEKVSLYFIDELLKCSHCEEYANKQVGVCRVCDLKICERCLDEYSETQKKRIETQQSESQFSNSFILFSIVALILLCTSCCMFLVREIRVQVLTVENLHSYFPSQTTDTWNHISSTLDQKFPTVKSLTLLHGKDDKTTECLVSKLIMVYTNNNNNIKIEDISFKNVSEEVKDYGEVLEYYRPIVEKHRIFVTDLNKIPANIARMFHSLCDEGSSPIKPSLFIFILRYNENVKHLKPLKRATTILQESWQDLPSNELFPLLSRMVKNVIDVTPEKHITC